MPRYATPIDVVNRALQHCRMRRISSFGDMSANASEAAFVYDDLRAAELGRNLWSFATKRVVLRPVDTITAVIATNAQTLSGTVLPFSDTTGVLVGQLVTGTNIAAGATVASFVSNVSVTLSVAISGTVASGAAITFGPLTFTWIPPSYSATTTYGVGQVVVDVNNEWWQSKLAANLAHTPGVGIYWSRYTGPDTMQAWATGTTYYPGELALASDGKVYLSLISAGEAGNDPTSTTGFWLLVNGTATGLSILYPIGAGPLSDSSTANVYHLPRGFLRQAPSNPKAGTAVWLGYRAGMMRQDWVFEGGYIMSRMQGPLFLRYVADFVDVPDMDGEFLEMLAARIAEEVAPILVTNEQLLPIILSNVRSHYRTERNNAVSANGIEIGPIDFEMDDYLAARF